MNVIENIGGINIVFQWVLHTSLMASVLVVLLIILKWLLKKRISIKIHYMLWILLPIRLILPFAPESSISLFNLFPVNSSELLVVSNHTPIALSPEISKSSMPRELSNENPVLPAMAVSSIPDSSLKSYSLHWIDYCFIIWLLGILVLTASIYHMNRKFLAKLKSGKLVSDPIVLQLYEDCKTIIGVKSRIPLIETSAVTGPTLFGLFRTKLLMPVGAVSTFQSDELKYIFYHELAHHRRKDIAFNWCLFCLLVVHWFNPLLWYAYSRMREDQELACDAFALTFVEPEKIRDYGLTIIRVLESYSSSYRAVGMTHFSSSKSKLKKRIVMIKQFSKKSYRWSILGLLLIFVLGGAVLTNAKSLSQEDKVTTDLSTSTLNTQETINTSQLNKDESMGSLTHDASIGQIHIGDIKPQVFRVLGEPNEVKDERNHFESWIYSKHDLIVQFYRASDNMPAGGVATIKIGANSDLKTDKGIGISSTLEQLKASYEKWNANQELSSIWINGSHKVAGNKFYPVLRFTMINNQVTEIELTNNGINPGPFQQKPLSYADLKIGNIEIDGEINDVVKNYGQPTEKTTAHGVGTPYWIFEKQGLAIDFGGPIWNITVFGSFEGSTPRGIHIGSSASEVIKAYPDIAPGESYIQTSTDGKYTIQFAITNGKVSQIVITRDLVLK